MDPLKEVVIGAFLLFIISVKAQNTSNQHDVNPLHPSMAVVLVVLSIMFCMTFLIVAYAKFCQRLHPRAIEVLQAGPDGIVRTRSRFSGIDRTIIESLPFFRFSSLKGSKEGLECAVCLSRFEETEILRLLPKCRHAFHMTCIDKWLENHSSCPLCRYKLNVGDIKSLTYTNSFRNPRISIDHPEPNLEFFIQREQSQERSSRFNVANTFQKLTRGKREEPLIHEFKNESKILHKVKHKIIVSDVILKSRWSDVNSSDLMSLNSEMLNVLSRKEISSMESRSGRFIATELSGKEQMLKMKEDMERKRLYESKIGSGETSSACPNDSNTELESSMMSKSLDPAQKRSMSEITNISRFRELNTSNRIAGSSISVSLEKDEKVRRLWLPIARRTIQWFSGREMSSEARKHLVNV